LNVEKAHEQLEEALSLMSLPENVIKSIKEESFTLLEKKLSENDKLLHRKKLELEHWESQLHSVESKWIRNEMAHDTYQRWHTELAE
jgi:hypothetical protein